MAAQISAGSRFSGLLVLPKLPNSIEAGEVASVLLHPGDQPR
jgi:hypothetical protein